MPTSFKISDGTVENMGDGIMVVIQGSDRGVQNVVLTREDLEAMLAAIRG